MLILYERKVKILKGLLIIISNPQLQKRFCLVVLLLITFLTCFIILSCYFISYPWLEYFIKEYTGE